MGKSWSWSCRGMIVVLVCAMILSVSAPGGLADSNGDGLEDVAASGLQSGVGHVYQTRTGGGSLIASRISLPENYTSVVHGTAKLDAGANVQPFVFGFDAGGTLGWVLRSFDETATQRFLSIAFPADIEQVQLHKMDVDGDGFDEFVVLGKQPAGSWLIRVFSEFGVQLGQTGVFPGSFTNMRMTSYQAVSGAGEELMIYGMATTGQWFAKIFNANSPTPPQLALFILYPSGFVDVTVNPVELNGTATTKEIAILGRDPSGTGEWIVRRMNSVGSAILGHSIAFPSDFDPVFLRIGEHNSNTTTEELMAYGQNSAGTWGRRFNSSGSLLNTFLAFGGSTNTNLQAQLFDINGDGVTDGSVVSVVDGSGQTLFKRFNQTGGELGVSIGFPSSVTNAELLIADTHAVTGSEIVVGGRSTTLGPIYRVFSVAGTQIAQQTTLNPNVF